MAGWSVGRLVNRLIWTQNRRVSDWYTIAGGSASESNRTLEIAM